MNLLSSFVVSPALIVCKSLLVLVNFCLLGLGLTELFFNVSSAISSHHCILSRWCLWFFSKKKLLHHPWCSVKRVAETYIPFHLAGTSGTISCLAAYVVCNTIFSGIRMIIGNKNVGCKTQALLFWPLVSEPSNQCSSRLCSTMTSGSHVLEACAMISLIWRNFSIKELLERA